MPDSREFLNPSQAAKRLGISAKALRLYERRGLLVPLRSMAGWRTYGPSQMARAAEIASLRALGLSLAEIGKVVQGDPTGLEPALASHQAALEAQLHSLAVTLTKVRGAREDLVRGRNRAGSEPSGVSGRPAGPVLAFDLPWPWGGERFELHGLVPLTYIIGPLGSGKTRLARHIADNLPGASFLGLDRREENGMSTPARLATDPALESRVGRRLARLVENGATATEALVVLLEGLDAEGPAVLVVDMIEQALDRATQEAVIAHLRRRPPGERPLFLLTRSSAILDLSALGSNEAILFCPANHSPPMLVAPYPGAPGYEAVASCLAPPDVRARTEGVIAWHPQQALQGRAAPSRHPPVQASL